MSSIRDIIEAATPGPWEANATAVDYPYVIHDGEDIASFDTMSNTIYCATFDPEHVALMETLIEASKSRFDLWSLETYNSLDDAIDALAAYRKERLSSGQ